MTPIFLIKQPLLFSVTTAINLFSVTGMMIIAGLLRNSELAAVIAVAHQRTVVLVIVLFFVFIDNSLKVSFHQPCPEMINFFLWEVLLNFLTIEINQFGSSK